MKKAVCLLSGGMDSTVACAIAKKEGYDIWPLSFDYNQKNSSELRYAKKIGEHFEVTQHKVIRIDLTQIGGSALTDDFEVPKEENQDKSQIPITYVPARNTIFLSLALAYAEVIDAERIVIGANHMDYSGYPDCRPEYIKRFQALCDIATKKTAEGKRIEVYAPLIDMTKAEIVKKGLELTVPFQHTWSCYEAGDLACGRCDSCRLRLKGFIEAGAEDPIEYIK